MKLFEKWRTKVSTAQAKKREAEREQAEADAIIKGEAGRLEAERLALFRSVPRKDETKATTIPTLVKAVREKWLAEKGLDGVQRLSGRLIEIAGQDPEVRAANFPEDLEVFLTCLSIVLPDLATQACANLLDSVPCEEGAPFTERLARFNAITKELADIEQEQIRYAKEHNRPDLLPRSEKIRLQREQEREARAANDRRMDELTYGPFRKDYADAPVAE